MLEKTLESPLDSKEIKSVNPNGNQSWIFIGRVDVEAPILWPPEMKSQLMGKDPDAGKDWGQEEKRATEDEMIRWHYQLNGHEFEQIPGGSEGQRSLACCSSRHHKESDKTEQLNKNWALSCAHLWWNSIKPGKAREVELNKSKTLHRAGRLPCSGSHKEENLLTVSSDPVRPHLGNKLN